MMQAFWKQWQKEYLTGLREQHSSQANKTISGQLVARGRVVPILRTIKVNLTSRPIEKLYPLEVLAEEDNLQDSKGKFKNPEEIRSKTEKRTQRAADLGAALIITELSKLNEL